VNGAESLLTSLIEAGVEVCFANPGTSEMQLVAAIDDIPGMRPILCLFEGVVSGAADGYGRMADKPAATLLHLGSGFANSMANLHNARRAHTPMVNIIGDHATYHLALDAPLTSDVPAYAALTSDWVRVNTSAGSLAQDGAEAVVESLKGYQANLIVPANHAWSQGGQTQTQLAQPSRPKVSQESINLAAEALRGTKQSCLYLGGLALREEGLIACARIAAATGSRIISEVFPARLQRGRGRPKVERLPYLGEFAADFLKDFETMVTVGTAAPVSFFAYPDKPGKLWPASCDLVGLAGFEADQIDALERLADCLESPAWQAPGQQSLPDIPSGRLTAEAVGAVVANLLPEQAIISDEAQTSGAFTFEYFDAAAPHDWLCLTGGAIGHGLPTAVGAAIACPERKVVALQADGSAMYTNQALWSMARERLDVCVIIYNNSRYAILNIELMRVGVTEPGERARSMLEIDKPTINWVAMGEAMGITSSRAETTEEFSEQFTKAMNTPGPYLIEAVI